MLSGLKVVCLTSPVCQTLKPPSTAFLIKLGPRLYILNLRIRKAVGRSGSSATLRSTLLHDQARLGWTDSRPFRVPDAWLPELSSSSANNDRLFHPCCRVARLHRAAGYPCRHSSSRVKWMRLPKAAMRHMGLPEHPCNTAMLKNPEIPGQVE